MPIPPESVSSVRRPGQPTCVVVIPCFNESLRLDGGAMLALADEPGLELLFVDDGSVDATGVLLDELATRSSSISVLHLVGNRGKGEAVRHGLLAALDGSGRQAGSPDVVAYYDADLATPPAELLRLVDHLCGDPRLVWVGGGRYGHEAETRRRADRRILGQCFSMLARRALGVRINDTQCGAKVMRDGPALRRTLERPFTGRWSFDLEILDRLLTGDATVSPVPATSIAEVALIGWRDIGGSKLGLVAMAVASAQVVRLGTRRGWRSRPPVLIDLRDGWDNPPVALYTQDVRIAPDVCSTAVSVQRS